MNYESFVMNSSEVMANENVFCEKYDLDIGRWFQPWYYRKVLPQGIHTCCITDHYNSYGQCKVFCKKSMTFIFDLDLDKWPWPWYHRKGLTQRNICEV